MKGDPVIYTLQCMMGNSDFKQVQTNLFCKGLLLSCILCPSLFTLSWLAILHSSPFYANQDTDGSGAYVSVTAGFKLPIMQRSLIHDVSQVSHPCLHIYSSQWPPAMLMWNNGQCRHMLISPHQTSRLSQGVEICGCHLAYVCFHPYYLSHWLRLELLLRIWVWLRWTLLQ